MKTLALILVIFTTSVIARPVDQDEASRKARIYLESEQDFDNWKSSELTEPALAFPSSSSSSSASSPVEQHQVQVKTPAVAIRIHHTYTDSAPIFRPHVREI